MLRGILTHEVSGLDPVPTRRGDPMKAIILSAGRGTRLLPWTTDVPKCLLPVDGERSVLEVQLSTLAACGIDEAVVMVGFGADQVEDLLRTRPVPGIRVRTLYNPFYEVADNLVTCWLARGEMNDEFLLVNGDTLFERVVLGYLQASSSAPLTLAIDEKDDYDDDDMKVSLYGARGLRAVGKKLSNCSIDGESIGLMIFRGEGPARFREALDQAIRRPTAQREWYLSVVERMAQTTRVETSAVTGFWWSELDTPADLAGIRADLDPADPAALPVAVRA
jgi:choline kinase